MLGFYRSHASPIFKLPFLSYALMIFFIITADATMSYMAPVVMETALGATKMGLILAISSFVGTFVDFTFGRLFCGKKSTFFLKIMFAFVLFFPLSFLFFQTVPSFIFAMIIWGVYFEAIVFSNYHAIHETVGPQDHAWAWGSLMTFKNLGWFIGPLIASFLIGINRYLPFYFVIAFYVLGFVMFILRYLFYRKTNLLVSDPGMSVIQHDLWEEFRIWKLFFQTIWPMLALSFVFMLIDSTFFSIGPLFGDSLRTQQEIGGLFISMYTLPGLLFGVLTGFLARPWGKKKAAFGAGIMSGLGLIVMSQVHSVWIILLTTFFASIGLSIFYPEITAVYEDYVARTKKFGNDFIGLTACMASIAYVVGPALNGVLADRFGTQPVFGFWGILMFCLSILSFLVVKRKVKLPQKEIAAVVTEAK